MVYRIAILCMLFAIAQSVSANLLKAYDVTVGQSGAELNLFFEEHAKYTIQRRDQGLIIELNEPLGTPDLSPLVDELAAWVQTIWASYDNLFLKPRPGVGLEFQSHADGLRIYFSRVSTRRHPSTEPLSDAEIAFGRAKALLALQSGQPDESRRQITELLQRAPNNPFLLRGLANVEEVLGSWRKALSLYEQAHRLQPNSQDIIEAKKRLLTRYGSKAAAGFEYLDKSNDGEQWMITLKGQVLTPNQQVVSAHYDRIHAEETAFVQRMDGTRQPFDVMRERLAISVQAPLRHGEQTLSLFGGTKNLGAGWAYRQSLYRGSLSVGLDWKRPWFETQEALFGYGYRDRLKVGYDTPLASHAYLYSLLSLNHYGLDGVNAAAKSQRFEMGGRYTFQPFNQAFSLGYGLDWEDVTDLTTRTDADGDPFFPLPLTSRELHVVDFGIVWSPEQPFTMHAQLGYEYDRQRDAHAPFGRLQGVYSGWAGLEWALSVRTGLSSESSRDERYFQMSSVLTWLF